MSSSLRDRLQRATAPASPSAPASVIPFDCIRDYLEEHRMVELFRLSVRDVHSALLYVERHFAPEAEEEVPVATRPPDCAECGKGYLRLDAHHGHYVCDTCGLVPHHGSLNVEREWIDHVRDEDLAPRHKRTRYVPGVSRWMVDRLSANPRRAYEREAFAEMENMNAYLHLSPDVLHTAYRNFLRWTENGYNRDVKMAACMFHTILRAQFLNDTDVRDMMRRRQSVPRVTDPTPAPTFPCRCGKLHYTKKAARFHSCRAR